MQIALDYDATYTVDRDFWDDFIKNAVNRGHSVLCVTMRYPEDVINIPCDVYYTSRQAKGAYVKEHNIKIDVWIDDSPLYILLDAK